VFSEIKRSLLEAPDSIINILEEYGFYKPRISRCEIRCGLEEGSNPTAICIRLHDNDGLYVNDFSRNINVDIIDYIIKVKKATFKDVLRSIKNELHIDSFYSIGKKECAFGGFYDTIRKQETNQYAHTYPESILDRYDDVYNLRFLQDNINFEAQDYFGIRYDSETQRIIIPIYSPYYELIGIKGRANWKTANDEPKYLFLENCPMSATLYGYAQNYQFLQNGDVYVFEAEKSVMQCYSYGIKNAVALGGNALSSTHCQLLVGLQPKRIIFLMDKSLELSNTMSNIKKLLSYMRMMDTEILYWDWHDNTTLPDKSSPSDCGKDILKNIIERELKRYDRKDDSDI